MAIIDEFKEGRRLSTEIMAIKHLYTVICNNAIQDARTGQLTLVEMFSNIILPKLPGGKARIFVVIGVMGEEDEEFSLTLEGPGRYKKNPILVGVGKIQVDLIASKNPFGANVTFASIEITSLVFDDEGSYQFVLRQGKKVIHRAPMGVFVGEFKEGS